MRRSWGPRASGLALAMVMVMVGCRPAMPDEVQARAAFLARRPAIERMEELVFEMIAIGGPGVVDDAAVERIAGLGGALGLRLTGLGSAPPCPGGGLHGSVAPADGFVEGRYRVGWGLYQTSWETAGVKHGDGAYHPGIIVAWELGEGGPLKSEATACFLLDGTPRPQ